MVQTIGGECLVVSYKAKPNDRSLKTLCHVKYVWHKRAHIICFHFPEVPRIGQFIETEGNRIGSGWSMII